MRMAASIKGVALASGLLICAAVSPAGAESGYRLGPQDRIRIKVVEWRSNLGQFFEWTPLIGEFSVSSAGTVSLPLIGDVPANGLLTGELARNISRRLQAKVGLLEAPDTSVEVAQFRPYYIVGTVERPGEYPYRPGMTVLQAVGIAGGLYRPSEGGLIRIERDAIAARGAHSIHSAEVVLLSARIARLQAELDGSDTIRFPPEVTNPRDESAPTQIIRGEEQILASRREALRSQLEGARQLVDLFKKEAAALRAKLETMDRQLNAARRELDTVSGLVAKGLAATPRQFVLERITAEIEGKKLDIDSSLLRALQELNKAERSIMDLRNNRRNEVLMDLQQSRAKLEEATQRARTSRALAQEAELMAPRQYAEKLRERRTPPMFTLVRRTEAGSEETTVPETALILPGDTIRVQPAYDALEAQLPTAPGTTEAGLVGAAATSSRSQ